MPANNLAQARDLRDRRDLLDLRERRDLREWCDLLVDFGLCDLRERRDLLGTHLHDRVMLLDLPPDLRCILRRPLLDLRLLDLPPRDSLPAFFSAD